MVARIIPIEEAHADSFHACLDYVAREKRYLAFQEAPPLESTRKFVRENVETGQIQLVALEGKTVVGWCDIIRSKLAAFSHVGAVGMGLLPDYRGKGIGRKMLTAAIDKAFSSGVERIELSVYDSNVNAIHLYRSLGFLEEGTMIGKAKIDGGYLNIMFMALFKKDC
jgi:ribosomal protein S18 acetylase RimI-like enzyme